MNEIDEHYERVIRRRIVDKQSFTVIAKEIDLSENSARNTFFRGMYALRHRKDVMELFGLIPIKDLPKE